METDLVEVSAASFPAQVHAATVRATGEKVAIKMSREAVSGSAQVEASQEAAFFRAEVEVMAAWCAGEQRHAHIVRCLGYGELPCRCDGMFACAAAALLASSIPRLRT